MASSPATERAELRFYAEQNDFLAPEQRFRPVEYRFHVAPSIKDALESCGVPHVEVERIAIGGQWAGFGDRLRPNDRVAVYPAFRELPVGAEGALREPAPRPARFVLDVHLGRLARLLRLLGFDSRYANHLDDRELAAIAHAEHRILLTRDLDLLKRGLVTYGYYVRETEPTRQAAEVMHRYRLSGELEPFSRCLHCNAPLEAIEKADIQDRLPPRTAELYHDFQRCPACNRLFWKGSHFERLEKLVERLSAAKA
jgi:uncharacterized protein with PIN domain